MEAELQRLLRSLLAIAAWICVAAPALAQTTPESLPGAKLVSAPEVRKMAEAGHLIIDTRTKSEFAESHIKSARSITYHEKSAKRADFDATQDRFDLTKLPADKSNPVVFYCNAGECWKSFKASKVAIDAGFKNVYWFRGGFPEWRASGLPVE
jgi:rhodanese-related sulfurtransferase